MISDIKSLGRDTLKVYIKGDDYNHMYKFGSPLELIKRVANNDNVPPVDSFVTEAIRDDNIIAINEPWEDVLNKILLIYDCSGNVEEYLMMKD